jgi:DNA-binding response OmpR family regulator
MTRILVVEDNAQLAYGLQTTLELEGYTVTTAADGATAIRRAAEWGPDLVILDLMIPEVDGYRVLRTLREQGMEQPVLILTAKGEEADKVLGFRLGADDYVTKPFGRLELVARVQALLRRAAKAQQPPAEPVERFGDVEVNPGARTVTRRGEELSLTPKEFDLLLALIRKRGLAMTRLQLLKEVWGHTAAVMTRTVDLHIFELRRKIEDDPSAPKHILTVRKVGYRFVA